MKREKYSSGTEENGTLSKHSTAVAVIVAAVVLSGTLFMVGSDISNKLTGFSVLEGSNPSPTGTNTGNTGNTAPTTAQAAQPTAGIVDMVALADDDPVLGDPNAPVTIIEFSDFECPFCERFHSQTLGQIKSEYIDTGKVKLIYRDYPLSSIHPYAQKAAEAAECADDQGKFWEYHDLLFTSRALDVTSLKQQAADLGLNTSTFNSCLDSGKYSGEVAKDLSDGTAAGVRGTPGFLVNGRLVSGAQPFAVFQSVIDAELAS